jgi:DNA-binding CsgD family transcriptional regulator
LDLTRRESQVLEWIVTGKSDWQIGQILDISDKTVNYHVENLKRKYGVSTRIQMVVAAVRDGQLPHDETSGCELGQKPSGTVAAGELGHGGLRQ